MTATPFGVAWEDLGLPEIRAFFADAGDEGLTWEAKGTSIRPEHVRKSVSAFGNGHLPGFLVLGASRANRGSPWSLDGWSFPDEPETWIAQCILNGGVRPRPAIQTKAWPIDPSHHVAVVLIYPVAVPPVITRDGQVWERLSGVSQAVSDPVVLRDLVARGQDARTAAEGLSRDGETDMRGFPPLGRAQSIIVSLACPALVGDVAPTVFRESTYHTMTTIMNSTLAFSSPPGMNLTRVDGSLNQGAITLWNRWVDEQDGYALRIGRHGTVVAAESVGVTPNGLRAVHNDVSALGNTWRAATELLGSLIPDAPFHATIGLWDPHTSNWTVITRWAELPGPWTEVLDSIRREARRTLGETDWEPEPGAAEGK